MYKSLVLKDWHFYVLVTEFGVEFRRLDRLALGQKGEIGDMVAPRA